MACIPVPICPHSLNRNARTPPPPALLCVSAIGAGIINAIAGGGTLLTFPALLWALAERGAAAGVLSNATPLDGSPRAGIAAGDWGYRRELDGTGPWLRLLFWPSLVGGPGRRLVAHRPSRQRLPDHHPLAVAARVGAVRLATVADALI